MDTMNETYKEIIQYYKQYNEMEDNLREMLRNFFSRTLINNNKDNPMECKIIIEPEATMGLSSLELPCIINMYQDPSEGWILFRFEGYSCDTDFDDIDTNDLMYIYKELCEQLEIVDYGE